MMDLTIILRFMRAGIVVGLFYSLFFLVIRVLLRRWFINCSIDLYAHFTRRFVVVGGLLIFVGFTSLGVILSCVEYGMRISLHNVSCPV